ncbi:MAG TPA: copper-binding protein [Steroidobacteraceae bacterium]|nr:copper-binding protein [Steroidobacteraceae bacterium]
MRLATAILAVAFFVAPAYAQQSQGGHDSHHPSAALSDGEVRKVDKDAKKITIKHGPLANLDMPAMTMVFQVADPAMLDQVKAGDKVKFEAEKVGGGYRITRIARAN